MIDVTKLRPDEEDRERDRERERKPGEEQKDEWQYPAMPTGWESMLHPLIPREQISNLWQTYYGPETGWKEPFDPWKHMVTAQGYGGYGFSAPQASEVMGKVWGAPITSPEWVQKEIGYLTGAGRGAQIGPREVYGENWLDVLGGGQGAAWAYPQESIDLWKQYYGISPEPEPQPKPIPPTPIPPTPVPPTPTPSTPAVGGVTYGDYPPVEGAPFPYPAELDIAGNVLARQAMGLPTEIPEQWDIASQYAQQMLEQGGMPVDIGQWWGAQQPALERRISDLSKQQTEQMGLGGLRWSTPLQRAITDITGRETTNLWADLAGRDITAQEAARGRMMETIPQLQQLGTGYAGLSEAAKSRGLTAAGMLSNVAQQRYQMPMDWASQMMGMGTTMQGTAQQAYGRQYQDFLRTMAESNPYLAQALGYTGLPSQMTAQQYQPSMMSQFLGLIPYMIPFLL